MPNSEIKKLIAAVRLIVILEVNDVNGVEYIMSLFCISVV